MRNPPMSPFKVCLFSALIFTLVSCGAPVSTKITTGGGGGGKPVDPALKPAPQVSGVDDQYAIALNEITWARQALRNSLVQPSAPAKVGCVTYTPRGKFRMTADYKCVRTSDESDKQTGRRFELSGGLLYGRKFASFTTIGDLLLKVSMVTPNTVVGAAHYHRVFQFDPEADSVYALQESAIQTPQVTFTADVTPGAGVLPETWTASFDAKFKASTSEQNPLSYAEGSSVVVEYKPESHKSSAAVRSQKLELIAQGDVQFAEVDGCLRPIGSFDSTFGEGADAKYVTLRTTTNGYSRSDDPTQVHAWGHRCLEH